MTNSTSSTAPIESDIEKLADSLNLDPVFTKHLPGDESGNTTPRQTPGVCWSRCETTPVTSPKMLAYFEEVAEALGINKDIMSTPAMTHWLSGNLLLPGTNPYATCYGGHQFGHWAGQLGDGRAITLAEITQQKKRWEIQLKGAGVTPYSRTADGRAVMRSSIREFLCSEAIHHLGIPTTRALSLINTGDRVVRDMFYDGNPSAEQGAIVCRTAPSFTRFGNFEILAARQEVDLLEQLIELTISRDFPELSELHRELPDKSQQRADWFIEVCRRTAIMVVGWQRVGFVHGVMNTDNMSILGLTIDYGPYGWLDNYAPNWTPNTTDAEGKRYRFANQPHVARWNLICLANALAYVIEDQEILKEGINSFDHTLQTELGKMQLNKFGLINSESSTNAFSIDQTNLELIETAYQHLHTFNIDFTLFFDKLSDPAESSKAPNHYNDAFYQKLTNTQITQWNEWLERYWAQIEKQQNKNPNRTTIMTQTNPKFILRNYLSQQAIEAADKSDFSQLETLMNRLRTPYLSQPEDTELVAKRPQWASNKPGCSTLSCSS